MRCLIFRSSIIVTIMLGIFAGCSPWAQGGDLSTLNRGSLTNFWSACQRRDRPVVIVSFGDSMADSDRSIGFVLINKFVEILGFAGCSMQNYRNNLMAQTSGPVVWAVPSEFWCADHYLVSEGGVLWWEKEWTPGGVESDRVGVLYVAQPGGGLFSVSVSTNGGPWTLLQTVDGFAPQAEGHLMAVDLGLGLHRLRVDGVSGTNVILGAQLLKAHAPGVHVVFVQKAGTDLKEVTNAAPSIRRSIWRALAPDLIIWHMKEGGGPLVESRLEECENWWSDGAPQASVLYIGTPWNASDTNGTFTLDQNTTVRGVAASHGRAYADCMNPAVSYEWMVSYGYMQDETHPNFLGNTYLANVLWKDFDFFMWNAPRSLAIGLDQGQVHVGFDTGTGVTYNLEQREESGGWKTIHSSLGTGLPVSTNLDLVIHPGGLLRLRLTPGS